MGDGVVRAYEPPDGIVLPTAPANVLTESDVVRVAKEFFPMLLSQRVEMQKLQPWVEARQGTEELYFPPKIRRSNTEYSDIAERAANALLRLVVSSMVQVHHVEGFRSELPGVSDTIFTEWRRQRFPKRQMDLYRPVFGYGLGLVRAYRAGGTGRVGWEIHSPLTATVFWDADEQAAEFPLMGMKLRPLLGSESEEQGYRVMMEDGNGNVVLQCKGQGLDARDWRVIQPYTPHGVPVVPWVQYETETTSEGRVIGQVEPLLPLGRRIDQDVFDRLILQRKASWDVRTASGLTIVDGQGNDPATGQPMSPGEYARRVEALSATDILVSSNPETKFGALPANDLQGHLAATKADLLKLSATSQTPPHHLVGLDSNLQAEALQAAVETFNSKCRASQGALGSDHETLARLYGIMTGDAGLAQDYTLHCRWRDLRNDPFAQAAQALGVLRQSVGVPLEMVFGMIPGWTDDDVRMAMERVEDEQDSELMLQMAQAAQGAASRAGGGGGVNTSDTVSGRGVPAG